MKKLLIIKILSILFILSTCKVHAEPLINAESYILIDSKTGLALAEYNSNKKLYPASTTKIVTAILAVEHGNMNDLLTVSQSAIDSIGPGGMHMGLMAGEQLELKHITNALLVQSANETAYAIAEHLAPSRENFYDMMNEKARELGATNTHFVNPCGMDNEKGGENHISTANDFAKISRYAMSLPEFRDIASKTNYIIPPTNKHPNEVTLYTTNRLMTLSKYKSDYYTNITGIKTGYTDRAGYNLVSSAQNGEGMELIAVVFGVREANDKIFDYSKELLEYGFKNYSVQQVVSKYEQVGKAIVSDAENPELELFAADTLDCVLPVDADEWIQDIQKNINIMDNISAPVKEGDVLGVIEVKLDGTLLGEVNLIALRNVEKLIPPAPKDLMYETISDPVFKKVVIGALIFLLLFTALKFTLRRISRSIKSKN